MMKPTCTICLSEISRPFFAHKNNDGKQHPFHKRCLMRYIDGKREAECPVCRAMLTQNNMSNINRANKPSNNANTINGVNVKLNEKQNVNRNNLGINRHQFLSYQPSMRGYFIIDTITGAPVVENRVARFINRNNYNFVLPNNRSDRHYINYNPNNNRHYIVSLNLNNT
jgi:hypothetical protein